MCRWGTAPRKHTEHTERATIMGASADTPTTTGATPATSPPASPRSRANFLGWLEGMRVDADVSWAEVSRRSGISENGLRKIRQGEVTPRPATVGALAEAFGIDPDDTDAMGALALEAMAPDALHGVPARRGDGGGMGATTYLTVGVTGPRASRLDPETAGRLILFLQHSARAWLATADCPERD